MKSGAVLFALVGIILGVTGAYSLESNESQVLGAMKTFVDRSYAAYRERAIAAGADPATFDRQMEEPISLSARTYYEMQQATHFLVAEAKAHAAVANYDLANVLMGAVFVNHPTETWDRLAQKAAKQLEEAKAEYEKEYGMKWKR